jgi:hypothetical protein
MSSPDFILNESFSEYFKREVSFSDLKQMYAYDLYCLDKIIEEGFFSNLGNALKKTVSAIKTAKDTVSTNVQKTKENIKQVAADKLQQMFSSLIVKSLKNNKSESDKLAKHLQEIQKDPSKMRKYAEEGQALLNNVKQESLYHNELFLVESLKKEISYELLLIEAKATTKSGRSLQPAIDQLLQILNTYKSPKAKQNALNRFNASVNKKIGTNTQQPQQNIKQTAKAGTTTKTPKTAKAQTQTKAQAQPQQTQQTQQTPQNKQGLFQKAFSWIKNNPNLTAGAVIGLVSAIALATGGGAVLVPLIYKGLTGATIAGGASAAGQKLLGGKVDWKKAGSAALKGAATGMALGGLTSAAGGIAHSLQGDGGDHSVDHGDTDHSKNSASNDHKSDNSSQDNTKGSSWDRYAKSKIQDIEYKKALAKAAGLSNGQGFDIIQGVPYDKAGNQLVDDETVKKIADQFKKATRFSK